MFTDALDEATACAARKVVDLVEEQRALKRPLTDPGFYVAVAEVIDREVKAAVCERFAFAEPER